MLSVIMLSVFMLSVVMLSVVMLSVVVLSVVMLNVVAPSIMPVIMTRSNTTYNIKALHSGRLWPYLQILDNSGKACQGKAL